MTLRVNDAIRRGYLDECVLIGGANGLDREIKIVSVVELPNAYLWCKGGELLLTALYSIKDCEEAQINMLENMNKNGAAGIVLFNYDSYLNNVFKRIISKADELRFPMFKAPGNMTYGDIIKPIMEALTLDKYKTEMSLFFSDVINSSIIKQGSLENLLKVISQKLNASIAVLDYDFSVIETYTHDNHVTGFNNCLIDRCIESYKRKDFVAIRDNILLLDIKDKDLTILLSYIKDHPRGKIIGYLLNASGTKDVLNETKLHLVGMSSLICGIQLQNRMKIHEIKSLYKNSFITNFLDGKFKSGNEIIERGKLVNLDMRNRNLIIVMKTIDNEGFSKTLCNCLYRNVKYDNPNNIILQRINEIIIIPYIHGNDEVDNKKKRDKIEHVLLNNIDERELNNIVIGVGNYYFDLEMMHKSYNEANKVIEWYTLLSSRFNYTLPTQILYYEDFVYISMIEHVYQYDTFTAYSKKLLEPIIGYDNYHNTELLKTMIIYFLEGLDVNRTASRLFIHKNTVNYRLLKIKNLLGIDPFQGENLVKFCISVLLQIFE